MIIISWGANQYGQLAHAGWPTSEQCEIPQACDTTGLPEGLAERLVHITGGGGHSLLLSQDGQLWACGLNNRGQCGQDPRTQPDTLVRPWHQVGPLGARVKLVVAGWEHTLALTEEGTLLGWGSNSHGQLGSMVPRGENTWRPVEVARDVQHVSAGLRHSAWVTSTGTLQSCGALKHTTLGLPEFLKAQQVACGQRHSLALISAEEGGQLWGWGDNRHGQLGCEPSTILKTEQVTPASGPMQSVRLTQVQSGWSHAAGITDDGQVVCWGRSSYGQLGIPANKEPNANPANWPLRVNSSGQPDKPMQLALGSEHTMLLLESGAVVACGWNEHGNCGTGDTADVFTPTTILQGARLIGCGAAHCFAVVPDTG